MKEISKKVSEIQNGKVHSVVVVVVVVVIEVVEVVVVVAVVVVVVDGKPIGSMNNRRVVDVSRALPPFY